MSTFKCIYCDKKTYSTHERLVSHYNTYHTYQECKLCKKKFKDNTEDDYYSHTITKEHKQNVKNRVRLSTRRELEVLYIK